MSNRAFVFLRRLNDQRSRFLGVVTVRPEPATDAQIQVEFRGKTETGRVTSIEPTNWDGRVSVTPTIHVIARTQLIEVRGSGEPLAPEVWMTKPTKTKSELEALILERARTLGLATIVRGVTVRALRKPVAGANWILVSMNPSEVNYQERQAALRQILLEIREQFDLEEHS